MPDPDETSASRPAGGEAGSGEAGSGEAADVAAELARGARDAAYVTVGLGVLGLQRAQAFLHERARQERLRQERLRRERRDQAVARLRAGVVTGARQVGEWVEGTCSSVSAQIDPLGAQLPWPARELAARARSGIEAIGAQARHLTRPPGS